MLAAESSSIIRATQSYTTPIFSPSGKQLPGAAVQVEEGARQSGVVQGNSLAAQWWIAEVAHVNSYFLQTYFLKGYFFFEK